MSTTTLQSCLEHQLVEPLTLRLTLAPKNSLLGVEEECKVHDNANTKKDGFGGWSFIESLTKDEKEVKETPYVHPLDKSSLSTLLSNKSLDLCTESLGSESGSDIGDENDLYFSSSSDSDSRRSSPRQRSRFCQPIHKKEIRRSFPPPLTSISGSDYVQFTPHREGGRLVIKAVRIATSQTCFQAERGNGRLTLRIKNSYDASSFSSSEEDSDDEEQNQETCDVEGEMEMVKCQRHCNWYKESGHDNKRLLNNWKPFLGVAI